MARSNIEAARLADNLLVERNRLAILFVNTTLTTVTLPTRCLPAASITVEANSNVLMPDEASNKGSELTLLNNSSLVLTVQSSSGAALTLATTLVEKECKRFFCDGTFWYFVGGLGTSPTT